VAKNRIRIVLEMIKFEHSVFCATLRASRRIAGPPRRGWLPDVAATPVDHRRYGRRALRRDDHEPHCRPGIRSAQSRTANRALPKGELSVGFAAAFTVIASAVLVLASLAVESARAGSSPVALAILFFYSFTKRFTAWSHFVLGFALGISPAAAWIAVAARSICAC